MFLVRKAMSVIDFDEHMDRPQATDAHGTEMYVLCSSVGARRVFLSSSKGIASLVSARISEF